MIAQKLPIVIGDVNGADKAVQAYISRTVDTVPWRSSAFVETAATTSEDGGSGR